MLYAKVAKNLIGMDLDKAKEKIKKAGCDFRLVEYNGKALIVTNDFNPKRINLRIDQEVVIDAYTG